MFMSKLYLVNVLSPLIIVQVIKGPSLASFNSNKIKNEKVLKQAIASVITGATDESINSLMVTELSTVVGGVVAAGALRYFEGDTKAGNGVEDLVAATYNILASLETAAVTHEPISNSSVGATTYFTTLDSVISNLHLLFKAKQHGNIHFTSSAVSSIQASYTVIVRDTHLSSVSLAGQLEGAVSSGAFNIAMQTFAAENDASDMNTAMSDFVSTDTSESSSSSATLSTKSIIGIAVGGFALTIILGAVVFYCCLTSTSPIHSASVHPISTAAVSATRVSVTRVSATRVVIRSLPV